MLQCGSVPSVQFCLALHHMWCASPSVLANLCCRGLGLMSWVTAGHSYQEEPHGLVHQTGLTGGPTSTTDGHKQAFLPKAAPTVCCLSLSPPSTCIPAWGMAVTWIASCSGPRQGWQVIHVCPCMGTWM